MPRHKLTKLVEQEYSPSMTKLSSAFCTIALASTSAFAGPFSTAAAPLPQPAIGVDILSDTRGIDLQPYMRHLISDLRQH